MQTTVEQKLIELIAKHAEVDTQKIQPDMAVKDTGIDSLGTAELMFEIEEHYDIALDMGNATGRRIELGTVSELANKLSQQIASNA